MARSEHLTDQPFVWPIGGHWSNHWSGLFTGLNGDLLVTKCEDCCKENSQFITAAKRRRCQEINDRKGRPGEVKTEPPPNGKIPWRAFRKKYKHEVPIFWQIFLVCHWYEIMCEHMFILYFRQIRDRFISMQKEEDQRQNLFPVEKENVITQTVDYRDYLHKILMDFVIENERRGRRLNLPEDIKVYKSILI